MQVASTESVSSSPLKVFLKKNMQFLTVHNFEYVAKID